jgi:hypothetical protein
MPVAMNDNRLTHLTSCYVQGRVLVSRQATFKELKRKIAGIAASPPHKVLITRLLCTSGWKSR